jgi:hypothetical protein
VAPGHAMALPMMPEFIAPQDGVEKQDCERIAAKRWLAAHARRLTLLWQKNRFCCSFSERSRQGRNRAWRDGIRRAR